MRIAHPVPRGERPWSGVFRVIVQLSAALAKRGHEVELWQLHEWSVETYAEPLALLQGAGVTLITVAPGRSLWRLGREASGLADRRKVDLMHLHGAFNPSSTAIARFLRRPYAFSPHSGYDPVSLQRSRYRKLLYRIAFERVTLNRAAMLVALTDVEAAQLRDYGAPGPVAVVPNGVARPPEGIDPHAFRQDLGLASDAPLVVSVCRLDLYRKGLDILVRGLAEAPAWHLALVGPDFRDVDRLHAMVAGLGLLGRVHFVGARHGERLYEALAAADVFALLSRWEGLPMALLEALSMGKPAIVSPAVDRLIGIEPAGAGWVAQPESLGPLLRRLAEQGSEGLADAAGNARLVARGYDWDSVAERYEAVYERARQGRRQVNV